MRRRKPPIEGTPAVRATCAGCGKALRPVARDRQEKVATENGWRMQVVQRTFTHWNTYGGLFHSLRCALSFAVGAHNAGYRIKSGEPTV